MAFTKTGQYCIETGIYKEAALIDLPKAIYRGGKRLIEKKIPQRVFKTVVKPPYEAAKYVGKKTISGVKNTGKLIANNPEVGLPLAGAGLYGAYKFPSEFKKNLYHMDPTYDVTVYNPMLNVPVHSGIQYRDKAYAKELDKAMKIL